MSFYEVFSVFFFLKTTNSQMTVIGTRRKQKINFNFNEEDNYLS